MNLNSENINIIISVIFCLTLVIGIFVFFGIYLFKKLFDTSSKLIVELEDDLKYSLEDNFEYITIRAKLINTGKEEVKLRSTVAFLDNLQSETKDYNPNLYKITSENSEEALYNLKSTESRFVNIKLKLDNKKIPAIINEFKYEVFLKTFHYENVVYKGEQINDKIVYAELNTIKNKYMYKIFENMSIAKGDYIFSLKLNYETDTLYESNLDKISFAFTTNNMHELLVDRFLRKLSLEIINYPINIDTKSIPISPDSIEKL